MEAAEVLRCQICKKGGKESKIEDRTRACCLAMASKATSCLRGAGGLGVLRFDAVRGSDADAHGKRGGGAHDAALRQGTSRLLGASVRRRMPRLLQRMS